MSDSNQSQVFLFDGDDPDMQRAYESARANFKYFWRELAWERRRIVPALDLACVKSPFSDGEQAEPSEDGTDVEHMWLNDVDFDGQMIRGVLLNSPNWLKTISEGDSVCIPLEQISDWMYSIGGEVYGAYTVNLMRSRMGVRERREHDSAWGLDFGDPNKIRLVPTQKKSGGLLKSLFGGKKQDEPPVDHAMSEAMAAPLVSQLAEDPKMVHERDERGWTLLHQQALAGSLATVKVLLDHGADPSAVTDHGMTPAQLAKSLGWDEVATLLRNQ